MRFGRLDLNLLVALNVLIEERSVSAAARRLCLSQPAATGALNRLRDYFGDELLVQSGRQMILTPKAIELAEPVRDALQMIRSRITPSTDFDPATVERNFGVISSDYIYHVLLAPALAEAAFMAPGVTFDIFPTDRQTMAQMTRGEADLLITVEQYLSPSLPQRRLVKDEHAMICWSEGRYSRGIDLEAFHQARHAVVSFGVDRFPSVTEGLYAGLGVTRRIAIRVPTFSALASAVIGTDRVATMFRSHAAHFARIFPLKVFPVPLAMPSIVESAQWHATRRNDEGVKWLLSVIQRHVPPDLSVSAR